MASTSGLTGDIVRKFEQEITRMVEAVGREDLTAVSFRGFVGDLRSMLAAIGRETLEQMLQAKDEPRSSIEVDGERRRFRGIVEAEWLTPFGKVMVQRRTYRANGTGKCTTVPLDDACSMGGRFMTSDIEEMAALGMAMLTAPEVAQILGKALPDGPSATAIQNAVHQRGDEVALHRSAIEDAISAEAPLSKDGDVLVASYDGVMTPMREGTDVAWRESGVATVSIYGLGKEGPEKRDTRYLARMPESGMKTLLEQVAEQVARAKHGRTFREFALLCDGKDAIWSAACGQPVLHDAVWIVDFFHAAENLMKAAVAILGEGKDAERWHAKLRDKLLLDANAIDNTIRTLRRCRTRVPKTGNRRRTLDNAIVYFKKHKSRMRYVEFIARGLPIGSGPVESAAKNIVQARLKRSGMRWSREGGQHVLDLRSILKSGRWEPMWNTLLRAA